VFADKCVKCDATIQPYKCENCGVDVFDVLVPRDNQSASKLLDMCRSLHGEENGIIGLAGVAKTGSGRLVLYTTTYPCNLCANKIVAAGIKEVVFAEPYTIREAEKILDAGGVNVRKFEGIKSTAYFRLYS
jgi:deoxycytidylate deaminase